MQHIQVKSEQVRKDEQVGIKGTQSHTHEMLCLRSHLLRMGNTGVSNRNHQETVEATDCSTRKVQ